MLKPVFKMKPTVVMPEAGFSKPFEEIEQIHEHEAAHQEAIEAQSTDESKTE